MIQNFRNLALIMISIIATVFALYYGYQLYYDRELRQLKNELNKIENVEVKNIWGHQDFTLEEISVRIFIKNKGEIVLNGLSKDVFKYPDKVEISEIGGLSFINFVCKKSIGISASIDIGKNSNLGQLLGIEFNSVKDIVDNYDLVINTLQSLKQAPKLNYFEGNFEEYLLIHQLKNKDEDPIYGLFGVENAFDYANTLQWKSCDTKNQ